MKIAQAFTFIAILVLLQGCYKEPVANFTYSYQESMAPANVTFENLSTEADKFIWDFGDGSSSNQKTPVHAYYSFVKPIVTLQASGRGGENMVSKTLGITSYYVKNSSNVSLYHVMTFFWDETQEMVVDDFELGFLGPGTDSDVVITNHAVIDVALELSDGTLYLVQYSYNLNMDELSYLNITDDTDIVEVTAKKKGSTLQIDPRFVRENGTSITVRDLALP
jgi:PKD repeat protein